MLLNAQKDVRLLMTCKEVPPKCTYEMDSSSLLKVACSKYLGIKIMSKLSWNLHINDITLQLFRIYAIYSISSKLRSSLLSSQPIEQASVKAHFLLI